MDESSLEATNRKLEAIIDRINVYEQDSILNEGEELDSIRHRFGVNYLRALNAYSMGRFSTAWAHGDIAKQRQSMTRILGFASNRMQENGDYRDLERRLEEVEGVYNKANQLMSSSFVSVELDRSHMQESFDLLLNQYVQSNKSLKAKLEALPRSLGVKHFRHVVSWVNSLSEYGQISVDDWNERYTMTDSKIRVLKNSLNIYPGSYDVSSLETKVAHYYQLAEEYYNFNYVQ